MGNVALRTLDGERLTLGVDGGRFAEATDDAAIDLTSLYSVRGLVDAHAHLGSDSLADAVDSIPEPPDPLAVARSARRRAWSQLASGVFLLFDKGAGNRAHLAILSEPPEHRPDAEMAGTILYPPGGYYPGFSPRELDLGDLQATIAAEASSPASWIKVVGDWPRPGQGAIPNFTEEQLARVVELAHAAGCRVAIHAAAPRTSSLAVAAGVDSIEHGLFLSGDDIRALGARGGAWVPTITAMSGVRDSLRPGGSGWSLFDEGIANAKRLLVDAVEAGVTVLGGTDLTLAHGRVAKEGVALAEAGMAARDVVHALTDAGYAYAGLGEPFAIGGAADAVAFATDPRHDVRTLTEPVVVVRRGVVIVDRR